MAGQYIVPLLGRTWLTCVVAVALSNTNMMPAAPESIRTSVLVVWGESDTSLGPSAASTLSKLPNSRQAFGFFEVCRFICKLKLLIRFFPSLSDVSSFLHLSRI